MSSPAGVDRAPVGTPAPPDTQDLDLREEWQDDGFPRPLPEEAESPGGAEGPSAAVGILKRRLVAPTVSLSLSCRDSNDSAPTPSLDGTPSLDINLEALETPSDSGSDTPPGDLEWEDELTQSSVVEPPGVGLMELDQVDSRGRRWRTFSSSGFQYQVDMSVLEPYLQVLSHGGYYGDGMNAIILVSSCFLPENTVDDYDYVMDNLFRYIIGTLDLMVSHSYLLVYLCAMAPRNKLPSIRWLHQCYKCIDRRLKKDLKGLLIVHPAWYIRALVTLVRPFTSDKFSRKVRFLQSLQELSQLIPTERLQIPDAVRQYDESLNR